MTTTNKDYVTLTGVLTSNPHKRRPNKFDPKRMGYTVTVVLDDGQEKKLDEIVETLVKATWPTKKPGNFTDYTKRVGTEDDMLSFSKRFINNFREDKMGNGRAKPDMYVRRGEVVTKLSDQEAMDIIYAGCHVAAVARPYVTIKPNPCVTLSIDKLLFLKDGTRMSGGVNASEAFEGFESEEEAVEAAGWDA